MIEILPRFNIANIILRNVKNEPGVGGELLNKLNEAGVIVEYFNATPEINEQSTITMIVMAEEVYKVMSAVNKARKKIKGENPEISTDIMEIRIRGVSVKGSGKPLSQAFTICGRKKVNIIATYTTPISIHLYISTKDFTTELIDELQKEYNSK